MGQAAPQAQPGLLDYMPVAGLTPESLAELLQSAGMHPPAQGAREGLAALTFRPDCRMCDLFETADNALNVTQGVLMMLECDQNAPEYVGVTAAAVLHQVRLAAGALALLHQGLFDRGAA